MGAAEKKISEKLHGRKNGGGHCPPALFENNARAVQRSIMGEAALLKIGSFPQTPIFPKRNAERGVSHSAECDSGRCPENPPTFEKVGSKLLFWQHRKLPDKLRAVFFLPRVPFRRASDQCKRALPAYTVKRNGSLRKKDVPAGACRRTTFSCISLDSPALLCYN